MSQLNVKLNKPLMTNGKVSMFIYCDFWTNQLRALMYELVPCVYISETNCFEASYADFDYLQTRCQKMNVQLNVDDSFLDTQVNSTNISNQTKFEYKTKPLPHQIDGIEFGLTHDKYLLADDMGLGKTKSVIDIACIKKLERGYKHCLVICGVNGLKWNWEAEIIRHSNEKSLILGNRKNNKGKWVTGSSNDKLNDLMNLPDDVYFIITNIETLRNKQIVKQLKKLCDNNTISMIAFDEAHCCASPDSQQSKGLLKLSAESMISMTGSPIMNSPLDLYMTLRWLGYDRHCFSDFKNQFCRMGAFNSIVGFKNMDQIQNLLKHMMIRRLKTDVLDLPPKIRTIEYVEMGSEQQSIYNEVVSGLREQVDLIAKSKNPLANLIRLRQATGHTSIISSEVSKSAKLDRLKQLVKELADNNKKCIVFSNWTSMTDILQEELKEYNPAIITGNTRDRVEQQNKFTNDDSCMLLIATIGAGGTGLTLTAAQTVIFMDSPWTASVKSQAEDRVYRIGTKGTVNIITLVTKNTIDEKIEEIIDRKGGISDAMLDNLSCSDITSLLNFLIG